MWHRLGQLCGLIAFAAISSSTFGDSAHAQNPLLDALGINSTNSPVVRQGQATQAQGGPTAPTTLGTAIPPSANNNNSSSAPPTSTLQPFGANLFSGSGAPPSATQTINPSYQIQPGDSVSVQIWGGVTAQSTNLVDPDGNIFLPNFGPIHVAGVAAGSLQSAVQHAIGSAYTNNVQIYAVLEGVHQINVFVSGFVKFPGRYAGSATDSALDYLVRAGGVDPTRGSYRDIELRREGRNVTKIDLYNFILTGKQLPVYLHEGDTIVVGKQLPMVSATGSVRNNYLFELPEIPAPGSTIIDLARPLPAATNAALLGTRNGQPYELYVPLKELATTPLYDQDQLNFLDDAPLKTVSVQIQGSRIGPSVLVANNHIRIADLLNYVAVDPQIADTKSAYILRQGLAAAQKLAIQEAADRLEKALYLAISITTGENQIQASEAGLVATYINNARAVAPEGRLVVTDDNGHYQDVRLEDNDIIVIPEKSQVVMVTGEVVYPQAVMFDPTKTIADYMASAGGFTARGHDDTYMVRRANGQVILNTDVPLRPGDELIALPYVPTKSVEIGRDLLQSVYEIAVATYAAKNF